MKTSRRAILDAGGLHDATIFASGNLDESVLDRLVRDGAPIDGFGVGTRMNVSADAPYLDCGYKLQEYAGRATRKRSQGKATWPGRKQVYRRYGPSGTMQEDTLTLADNPEPGTRIGIYDARAKLSKLIERVQSGEEVVLTRHGEPVARLVPENLRRKRSRAATVTRIRALARNLNIRDVDVRKLIEEGRR